MVPDAFTALILTPIGDPAFPFLGTDRKYHVTYDLQLTNASGVASTLAKLDVVDGAHPSKVIASFSGTALVDPGCSYGNCNRLRMLPSSPAASTNIPPQEGRVIMVDFTFRPTRAGPQIRVAPPVRHWGSVAGSA